MRKIEEKNLVERALHIDDTIAGGKIDKVDEPERRGGSRWLAAKFRSCLAGAPRIGPQHRRYATVTTRHLESGNSDSAAEHLLRPHRSIAGIGYDQYPALVLHPRLATFCETGLGIRARNFHLRQVVYFCADGVASAHEGLKLGIEVESCGRLVKLIKKEYKKTKCDLGELANRIHSSPSLYLKLNPPDALALRMVFDTFRIIAEESRKKKSEENRRENNTNYITPLLAAAIDCEPKYLVHLLQMKLHIGYAEPTLLAALGQAGVYYTKEHPEPATLKDVS